MEAMKHQGVFNKFVVSFFVKMTTRFVLPVSVLSIIVSYSPILPFVLHNFKFSFSAHKMQQQQFFGYNIDKNYMFLLCNGILCIIVKNSGLISKSKSQSPQVTDISSEKVNRTRGKPPKAVKFAEPILEEKVIVQVEAAEEAENLSLVPVDAENGSLQAQAKEKEEENAKEKEEGNQCLINDEDALSTEELNKKCEEFIRRMKLSLKHDNNSSLVIN